MLNVYNKIGCKRYFTPFIKKTFNINMHVHNFFISQNIKTQSSKIDFVAHLTYGNIIHL